MPIIQFSTRASHQQLEIPSEIVTVKKVKRDDGKRAKKITETKKLERSAEGSLHVRPGQTRQVTADELKWLRDNTDKRLFVVLAEKDPPKKEAKKAPPKDEVAKEAAAKKVKAAAKK